VGTVSQNPPALHVFCALRAPCLLIGQILSPTSPPTPPPQVAEGSAEIALDLSRRLA